MAEWPIGPEPPSPMANGRPEALGLAPMRGFGRSLQLLGLVLLPVGLIYGLERGPNAMALEIGFGTAGVALFLLGLALQRKR